MPESLEEIIAQAKARRRKAQSVEALEDLRDEGVLGDSGDKREVTAYERAAETITDGLHKVNEAKTVLQHANIPTKVIAPVLEIIITTEAMIEELKKFVSMKTLDVLTIEENRILVVEAVRIAEAIPLILTAKDGFRAIQAVTNLQSLVSGEAMMRAQETMIGQQKGVLGTIKSWFAKKGA